MDELGNKVDGVLSVMMDQIDVLKTENALKSMRVEQLSKTVSELESKLAMMREHISEQHRHFSWLQLKFEAVRAQQTALIELLETKLGFAKGINDKLCELISKSYACYRAQDEQLSRKVENLEEQAAAKDHYEEKMKMLLSEGLQRADPEISNLLERYASDVRDARRKKNFFEAMLLKFKGDDHDSREGFLRLCGELIEKQKQFVESQTPTLQRSPPK